MVYLAHYKLFGALQTKLPLYCLDFLSTSNVPKQIMIRMKGSVTSAFECVGGGTRVVLRRQPSVASATASTTSSIAASSDQRQRRQWSGMMHPPSLFSPVVRWPYNSNNNYRYSNCHYYSTTNTIKSHDNNTKVTINLHSTCPYTVLNVPRYSDHATVKRAFLRAVLVYHPDQADTGNITIFTRIREAFEEIVSSSKEVRIHRNTKNGDNTTTTNQRQWTNEQEFQIWLQEEIRTYNKQFLTFDMDERTRQEIIQVHNTQSRGGIDRGGYWEMARLIAEKDNNLQKLHGGGNHRSRNDITGGLVVASSDTTTETQQPGGATSTTSGLRRKRPR